MDFNNFVDFAFRTLLVGTLGLIIWCALSMASKSKQEKQRLERLILRRRAEPREHSTGGHLRKQL